MKSGDAVELLRARQAELRVQAAEITGEMAYSLPTMVLLRDAISRAIDAIQEVQRLEDAVTRSAMRAAAKREGASTAPERETV